jgi:hypothetical protein
MALTFITESESTQLGIFFKGFHTDRSRGFDTSNHLLSLLDELWWALGLAAGLFINQVEEGAQGHFFSSGMHV